MSAGAGRGCRANRGFGATVVATIGRALEATGASIGVGGIAAGEIPGVEVCSLNADLTTAGGIEATRAADSFFFGSRERGTVFVFAERDSGARFRTSTLLLAVGAAPLTGGFVDNDLAGGAFKSLDSFFDGATLFLSAEDGTAEFFLDLPTFIGGPTRPAPATR
jgi:hypothetical protein